MWPILLCSVISITIILERFYHFHSTKPKISNLTTRVKTMIKEKKHTEALRLCEEESSPTARLLAIGIHIRNKTLEEKDKIIKQAGSKIIREKEKYLRGLAVIGNISPLLGLLGTVTGIIKAFIKIQELNGTVDSAVLAGGIWEALITTAAGLCVAIPTLVAYYYFEGKIDTIASNLKDTNLDISELYGI
ncbi:MAG: MotA/TolQ/ExbB proton channel family protein [Candidatus Omnitrophota bacterium]|nr:MotA/TolQ/ExbB proton channel family protein [Candidatus Omnitrophota bacterium]